MVGLVGPSFHYLTPEQIYDLISSGRGPESLGAAQAIADEQSRLQEQINDRVGNLQRMMASGWTGGAGEQAANAATPVGSVAAEASIKLAQAQTLIDQQRAGFEYTRSSVTPMPPNPGEPSFVDEFMPALTDHAEKAAAYKQAAQINKDTFDQYHGISTEVGGSMPTTYGSLKAATGDTHFELVPPKPGDQTPPDSGGTGGPGGSSGGVPGGGSSPGGFGSPAPGGGVSPPGSVTPGGGWQAPETPAASVGDLDGGSYGSGKYDDGSTGSAGFTTPGGVPNVPGSLGTNGYPGGSGAGYPGGGSGGGYGSGSGSGSGSGGGAYGGGAYGTGAAPGSGSAGGSRGGSLGAGRGSGVAPYGSSSGGGYTSSSAGSSASGGSRGMRPPMMGGAGAGRGQGGEDETHERPSYLEEADPESVFVGELPKVAPEVIGE